MIITPAPAPLGRKGRAFLSVMVVLIALVLGSAGGAILTQNAKHAIRQSDWLGGMLCGAGQHIHREPVPGRRRGSHLICRDAGGRKTGGRNNGLSIVFALPFILIIAIPGLWLAWKADIRMTARAGRSRR